MKLLVLENNAVVHSLDVPTQPLSIGRAADNGLILQASQISAHHALLFHEHGQLWVRDLGSTNGVFLNGARVTQAPLAPGDLLGIGVLGLQVLAPRAPRGRSLQVRQLDGPVAWSVQSGVAFPGDDAVTLFIDDDGVWLDDGPRCVPIAVDEVFEVGGQSYRLEQSTVSKTTTGPDARLGYALSVDLPGGRAVLKGKGQSPVTFRAEGRVALLYVLAQADGDWVDDLDVGQGVWGRAWHRQGPNNLNVLVHRVREQAGKGGYDRGFVERRRGGLRLRVEDIQA